MPGLGMVLEQSYWTMCLVRGQSPLSSSAPARHPVFTTVVIKKTQGQDVREII